MNDAIITIMGFVAAEPRYMITSSGAQLMSLRIGSTPRRYDRESGQWRDEDTMFVTVNCWRTLADNLHNSDLKRGDPLIVTGRLRVREYEKDGQRRVSVEVEATTVGHDLSRGIARFQRSQRTSVTMAEDRQQADEMADAWLGDKPNAIGDSEDRDEDVSGVTAEPAGDDVMDDDETAETDPGRIHVMA